MRTPWQSVAKARRRCCVLRYTFLPLPLCITFVPFISPPRTDYGEMNNPLFLSHLFLSPSSPFLLSFTKHRVGIREFMLSSRDSHNSRGLVLLCGLEKSISFGQGIYCSIILCKYTNRSPFISTFAICLTVCLILAFSPSHFALECDETLTCNNLCTVFILS